MQNFRQVFVKKSIFLKKNFFQCAQKNLHFISKKNTIMKEYLVEGYFDKNKFFVL